MKADYWFRSVREINAALKAGLIEKDQAARLFEIVVATWRINDAMRHDSKMQT